MRFCGLIVDSPSAKFICNLHFTEESYQASYRAMGRERKEWRLIEDAIPTLNHPDLPDQEPLAVEELSVKKDTNNVEIEIVEDVM